jgi:hypothetical protein
MIDSTIDMYQRTLLGIKKESTSVLPISRWNDLINEVQEVWVREKSIDIEQTSKRIDDVELLRVATDGINGNPPAILPVAINKFPLPISLTQDGITYPQFLKFLNVEFKIDYVSNPCHIGTSDWQYVKIMRSDSRATVVRNAYRTPNDDRLYYEIIGGYINLITGTPSTGNSMRLEYLRKPKKVFLDVNSSGAMMRDADNPNYLPHTGSVNCEFTEFQRQEIVDLAVQTYLERIKDERYKSYLNEEAQKNQSK